MKKELLKIGMIFMVIVVAVFFGLNYIFFSQNAPKSKATGETMNLSFNPASSAPIANADFTVSVLAKPSINTVLRGYKTKINFDKAILKIKSIQYKTGVVSADLGNTDADIATINNNGYFNLVAEDTSTTGMTLTSANGVELATLTFTAITNAPTGVTFTDSDFYSINSDNVLSNSWTYAPTGLSVNGGQIILPTPTTGTGVSGTPIPTATTAPGSSGNGKLKMKLKFQGIAGKPTDALNKMTVKIKLLNESTGVATDYKSADFTGNDSGVWSGEINFDVVANVKYTAYVKGPFHIQKKVCVATPTETAGGTYKCANGSITLSAGDNNLDFSGIVMLAGDLPVQDGTVNAYDTSLVRNNLGKSDEDAVSKADVNRDGKVDTQDYSLIISALSVKNDEE